MKRYIPWILVAVIAAIVWQPWTTEGASKIWYKFFGRDGKAVMIWNSSPDSAAMEVINHDAGLSIRIKSATVTAASVSKSQAIFINH